MNRLTADKAVALMYRQGQQQAPKIVASGQGSIAKTIIERARQAGVAITEDPALVEILGKLPVGDEIPIELYQAVAEILALVYRLESAQADAHQVIAPVSEIT
jgi:flagellar biosynthesis protein